MDTNNNNSPEQRQLTELKERIKSLEKLLEEKDDQYFELSATMATIQAEAKFETEKMRRETTMQLKLTREDLRRTTQEANQAHIALARMKKYNQKYQVERTSYSNLPSQSEDLDLGETPPPTIFVSSERGKTLHHHTGQLLARHLLVINSEIHDDISFFLNNVQFSSKLCETSIVWQILQHSFHNTTQDSETWLCQALDLSPLSRNLIRRACCDSHKEGMQNVSRIQYMSQDDIQAISVRILNPLWSPGMMDSPIIAQSNTFQTDICKSWMEDVCSKPDKWYIVSTLLWDSGVDDERLPWYTFIQEGILTKWESFVKSYLPVGTTRRTHDIIVDDNDLVMSKTAFMESLYLLCDIFHKPCMERSVMAMLLDILEFEIYSKKIDFQLMLSVLIYISHMCQTDTTLIRTKMTKTTEEDGLAQSGIGVIILILMASQIQLDDRMQEETQDKDDTNYERSQALRDYSIRILHHIFLSCRHIHDFCLTSVLVEEERWHDYLGACSQVFLSPNTQETIQLMTRLQLEELQAEKEEEEENVMK
jgi:hypothetical protein